MMATFRGLTSCPGSSRAACSSSCPLEHVTQLSAARRSVTSLIVVVIDQVAAVGTSMFPTSSMALRQYVLQASMPCLTSIVPTRCTGHTRAESRTEIRDLEETKASGLLRPGRLSWFDSTRFRVGRVHLMRPKAGAGAYSVSNSDRDNVGRYIESSAVQHMPVVLFRQSKDRFILLLQI